MRRPKVLAVLVALAALAVVGGAPGAASASAAATLDASPAVAAGLWSAQSTPPLPPTAIAYVTGVARQPINRGIAIRSATGTRPAYVPNPIVDSGNTLTDVEYDPAGERLALVSGALYLAQTDASHPELVDGTQRMGLDDVEWSPSSPDTLFGVAGSAIVRIRLQPHGPGAPVATVDTIATFAYRPDDVRPSPAGDEILARVWAPRGYQVQVVVSVATGAVRRVSTAEFSQTGAAWSADGDDVLYVASSGSGSAVYAVDRATLRDPRVVVPLGGADVTLTGAFDGMGRPLVLTRASRPRSSELGALDTDRGVIVPEGTLSHLDGEDLTASPGGVDDVGTCAGFVPTLQGTAGDDVLVGTSGDDVILGLGGDDVINGMGGDDVLCGGAGEDRVNGGTGADRVYGDAGDDRLRGDAGNDLIGAGDGDDVVDGGDGDDHATTGPGDDVVDGGPGADQLRGGDGADLLRGGVGDDVILPGLGRDSAEAGTGDDVVYLQDAAVVDGGDGDDVVAALPRYQRLRAVVHGGAGDDSIGVPGATVFGEDGADRLYSAAKADGGPGDDYFSLGRHGERYVGPTASGGDGDDDFLGYASVDGGAGDDRVYVGQDGDATIDGGDGDDDITAGPGADVLHGGPGDDVVRAGGGDDLVFGDGGSDHLLGGDGDDALDGGPGRDLCRTGDTIAQVSCEVPVPRV